MLGDFPLGTEPLGTEEGITAADADLLSAFNFCNPFDTVLPPPDSDVSGLDMQHLWGLSTSVAVGALGVSMLDYGRGFTRSMKRGFR
jgi:hypothetical protein